MLQNLFFVDPPRLELGQIPCKGTVLNHYTMDPFNPLSEGYAVKFISTDVFDYVSMFDTFCVDNLKFVCVDFYILCDSLDKILILHPNTVLNHN